jgi:hypothetical protein
VQRANPTNISRMLLSDGDHHHLFVSFNVELGSAREW